MTEEKKHTYDANSIRKYREIVGICSKEAEKLTPEELDSRLRANYDKAKLTYRERTVLDLRYGFGDGYVYTLDEVGRIFNVTRERVRQLEHKAVRKMKASLEESL